jgi:crotonobetainyl-CoA:carnitine CoA-transferase CaiB-like acyl-CoA transferase
MAPRLPLEDVKILDFMWVMAGPAGTRMLADYGAVIVRIESPTRVDVARTLQPFPHNQPGPDASALFGNCNAGKFGITLDIGNPASRDVIFDLVRWADVVTESFSPKAMRAWDLDYAALSKIRPDLIMLSTCLMGQSGPLASFAGFGNLAAAISGFHNLTGWPDRPPSGPFGAYTDYVSPRFTAIAILAALEYRRRTGKGQYIDQSQGEASLHFLGPAILDYTVNGRVQMRDGNRDPVFAPHAVYPARGDDAWVAIVCRNDDDFRALCEAMGREGLARDQRFVSAEKRRTNAPALDSIISEWTRAMEPQKTEQILQARGIPAHAVQNSKQYLSDPQIRHRGHFVELPHPVYGTTVVEGPRAILSRTPAQARRAAPTLGQDNQYVLEKILGYSDERIGEIAASGVLG